MAAQPGWDYIAKLVCIGDSGCGKSSLTIRLCEGRFVTHHDVTIGVEFGSRIVPVGPPHSKSLPPSTFSTAQHPPPATSPEPTEATTPTSKTDDSARRRSSAAPQPSPTGLPEPRRSEKETGPQKHMKLSLWDTAGQETYKSVTRSYFRGASGALLVFDLTRKATFQHVTDWLNDLRQIAEPDIVVVLVGNKADLTTEEDDDGDGDVNGNADGTSAGADEGKEKRRREVRRDEAEAWARRNGVLEYVETSAKSGENVEMAFMRVAERIFQNIQAGKYDLNDRRSGVKGPGASSSRQQNVSLGGGNSQKGAGSGACC